MMISQAFNRIAQYLIAIAQDECVNAKLGPAISLGSSNKRFDCGSLRDHATNLNR